MSGAVYFTLSPNLQMQLPIPGLETGIQYAVDQNNAFLVIDSHDHTPGKGLPVPTTGININGDLPFNGFNALTLRSSRYNSQGSALALVTDINCVYAVGADLWYNDGVGNKIQMTIGGAVNTSGSGNISGMGATTATVVYTVGNATFTFNSNTNTPALIKSGPLQIGLNAVSPFFVTLIPNAGQTGNFTQTLPISNPASLPSLLAIDTSGNQTYVNQQDTVMPSGMIMAFGGTATPAGWLQCDGSSYLRATYANLYSAIGNAYGTADGTHFNVPDLRGQFLRGVDSGTGRDPDAAGRTAMAAGGATGNNVGSIEAFAVANHVHSITDPTHNHTQNAHSHTTPVGVNAGGFVNDIKFGGTNLDNASTVPTSSVTATNNATSTGITGTNSTGQSTETRPLNAYVVYLIKL